MNSDHTIFQIITTSVDRGYDEDDYTVETKVKTLESHHDTEDVEAFLSFMLKSMPPEIVRRLVEALAKDDYARKHLKELGYVHLDSIKNREQKITAKKRFFILETRKAAYTTQVHDIDPHSDESYTLTSHYLAEGGILVQEISPTMLKHTCPDFYKEYTRSKKEYQDRKAKETAKAKKRRETKQKKKIEMARKLLEELDGKSK